MAEPLSQKAIQTINNFFAIMRHKGLVPALPWGSSLIPDKFQANNSYQLTQDELQAILNNLYSTFSSYQETATALQVITSRTTFPINLASPAKGHLLNSIDNLMNAVALPTIGAAQRGMLKNAILRNLASEIITPKTHEASNQLLCTISVEKNSLTRDDFQQLLNVFIEQSTQLSISINAIFPIFLGTPQSPETNLEKILFSAITSQSKNGSVATPTPFLLNFSVLPKQNVGEIGPNEKPNPQPLGDPMLTQLSQPNTETNPTKTIAPKKARVIETHDSSFWKCCRTKQTLIHFTGTKEDEETAKLLVSSYAYYVNLRDNSQLAAHYSGIIIGALVTLLEAVRQTNKSNASLSRGLDLTLLIIPVLLGLISKICHSIVSSSQEKIDRTDRLLKDMEIDIDIETGESDNVQPINEPYRSLSSAKIYPS